MSGIWMMHNQGKHPQDNLTTTYVPGLDRLRRHALIQIMCASASTALICAGLVAMLWGVVPWWQIAINVTLVVGVYFLSVSAGAFMGRLGAFADLSRARVRVERVQLEEDE